MTFTTGKKEIIFAVCLLFSGLLTVNSALFGGLNLGFSLGVCLCILCSFCYLYSRSRKAGAYPVAMLVLSLILGASFARADDFAVKSVLVILLPVTVNLALCLLTKQNLQNPATALSLLDSVWTLFDKGLGKAGDACRSMLETFRNSGSFGKKGISVLLGLCIALPLVLILVPLLMFADAAFEGLVDSLPQFDIAQIFVTLLFGVSLSLLLYSRSVALRHCEPGTQKTSPVLFRGLSALTVNTVLIAVCVVYLVYLFSQLAYFSGGFAGILPEGYSYAEYARRGFFEMAWLCALNLAIIIGALWICQEKDPAPRLTRWLCLFIGVVTLFLVAAASAKMLLYIDGYGLTRLRVLTQVIMIFLGLVTVFVCLWLFIRKLPYMKCVMLTALALAAIVSWADVDTLVAKYNTESYLSGELAVMDVDYLGELGDGAVPYLAKLAQNPDENIREAAIAQLIERAQDDPSDLRGWNYASSVAETYLKDYRPAEPDIRTETAE